MLLTILLQSNLHTITPNCADSLRHCYDSLRFTNQIASSNNGISQSNFSNIISIVSAFISIAGAWGIIAYKGGKIITEIEHLKDSIKTFKEPIAIIPAIQKQVDTLWTAKYAQSNSPMVLNANGIKVLQDSGIDKIIDIKYDFLVDRVKELHPKNAYEVQQSIRQVVDVLIQEPELKNEIEISAFKAGVDAFVISFVGSLYIRDRIITDLGFKVSDIDTHKPPTNPIQNS
jgi:hypothetical protein